MKNSIALKIVLFLCGILILIPGVVASFSPVAFTARNGIDLAENFSLFNDYRAMGGLMMGSGIIILLGLIHNRMTFTSTVVAAVMYSTLTLGRLLSIGLDGMPARGLVGATVVEGILAVAAIIVLVLFRKSDAASPSSSLSAA